MDASTGELPPDSRYASSQIAARKSGMLILLPFWAVSPG
jgi:hypothetical protein